MKKNHMETRTLTGLAMLTAIVFVLQMLGSFIRPTATFSISLVLVPIVIGAALYGAKAGAWLGFVFGAAVLISGDAALFLPVSPLGTIVTVLLKGLLAGYCGGLAYRALEKKNRTLAVFVAAVVTPCVNSGVFILGCLVFFMEFLGEWGKTLGYDNAFAFTVYFLVLTNFLIELTTNLVLVPTILRLISLGKKHTPTATVRAKYNPFAVGSMAAGLLLTLGSKLCGTVFFHIYAAARRYSVYLDGANAYVEQPLFDSARLDRVFAADFQEVFAFVGALLLAFGLVRFFKHLNAEPKEEQPKQ